MKNVSVLVGYLCHARSISESSTFIQDFYLVEGFRGRKSYHQAIEIFANQLKTEGISRTKSRIAYHNERARKLYEELGFAVAGINMCKSIESV